MKPAEAIEVQRRGDSSTIHLADKVGGPTMCGTGGTITSAEIVKHGWPKGWNEDDLHDLCVARWGSVTLAESGQPDS